MDLPALGAAYGFGGGATPFTAGGAPGLPPFFALAAAGAAVLVVLVVPPAPALAAAGDGSGSMTIDDAAAAGALDGGGAGSAIGTVPVDTSTGPGLLVFFGASSVDTAMIADAVPTTMQSPTRKMQIFAPRLIFDASRGVEGERARGRASRSSSGE